MDHYISQVFVILQLCQPKELVVAIDELVERVIGDIGWWIQLQEGVLLKHTAEVLEDKEDDDYEDVELPPLGYAFRVLHLLMGDVPLHYQDDQDQLMQKTFL